MEEEGQEGQGYRKFSIFRTPCIPNLPQQDSISSAQTTTTSVPKANNVTATTSPLDPSVNSVYQPNKAIAGQTVESQSAIQPPVKEPEIVTALSEEDVHSLFAGAPQFSVTSNNGQLNPRASFPWDYSLGVRDVSDCRPIEHLAFASMTIRKHLPAPGSQEDRAASSLGYDIGVVEVPSMLSARGNEPGTIGFEYFLQDPMSDSLEGDREMGGGDRDDSESSQNYEMLQTNPERLGIRKFDLEHVAERLSELSEFYQDDMEPVNILKRQQPSELYSLLFSMILTPPKFDATTEDPTGLKVQIEALTRVLKLEKVWYDFSLVEWRIRAGQTLWSESAYLDAERPDDSLTGRDILLLQLVLSCELLVRLEAVASMSAEEVQEKLYLTPEETRSFRDIETIKTKWDLVLARRFLENVEAKRVVRAKAISQQQQPAPKRGFFSAPSPQLEPALRQDRIDILFLPRKSSQQLSGLFHFAKAISWPDEDRFERDLEEALRANEDAFSIPSPSIYATPLSTPRSGMSARSSGYFDTSTRPQASRMTSQQSIQLQPTSPSFSLADSSGSPSMGSSSSAPKALIGGWLTRSYLTGLVMPGEAISHFLISTILENDATAISTLGDSANLYGGFTYKARSWFSKSCVVGRVLACHQGASDCVGWISVPCLPQGFEDGWIDVKSKVVKPQGTLRIKDCEAVEADSSILVGAEMNQVDPKDFVLPRDSDDKPVSSLYFNSLQLDPTTDSDGIVEDAAPSFHASLHFSSSSFNNEHGSLSLGAQYLVDFISSFPCSTPPPEKLLLISGDDGKTKLDVIPAHPLHKSQSFQIIPATTVLADSFSFPLKVPDESSILVLDARGDDSLELLARAWCSSIGQHAIISRVGITCVGCSVREARALAVKIVIRIE
jgi:hypothetical protein